jgi:hypothetical protein
VDVPRWPGPGRGNARRASWRQKYRRNGSIGRQVTDLPMLLLKEAPADSTYVSLRAPAPSRLAAMRRSPPTARWPGGPQSQPGQSFARPPGGARRHFVTTQFQRAAPARFWRPKGYVGASFEWGRGIWVEMLALHRIRDRHGRSAREAESAMQASSRRSDRGLRRASCSRARSRSILRLARRVESCERAFRPACAERRNRPYCGLPSFTGALPRSPRRNDRSRYPTRRSSGCDRPARTARSQQCCHPGKACPDQRPRRSQFPGTAIAPP